MRNYLKRFLLLFTIFVFFQSGFILTAQAIKSGEIDSLAERTIKEFNVPGIAIAIVKDGKIIHARGYGVRSLNTNEKVDANTLFGIASNSKAFTTAALGILADEKKLTWNDKVTDYIPEFQLYDPWVTREFTIRDLLTHRSGLGLGAGDLMIWPGSNNFTLQEIIHNLRYLKPVSSFRTKFDYDNLLYIVAGEVIARVSGMSWEEFIETRIMQPLGMVNSAASFSRLNDKTNVIDPHAPVDGTVQVINRDMESIADAAGGIYSSINDMSKWIIMQMNNGKYGANNEKQLLSREVKREMWSLQTILPVGDSSYYNTHFGGYGLGWFLNDEKGYKKVWHTGGLAGIVTQVTLFPEMKLGIIVFTNQQSGAAFTAITNTIKDHYFGIKGIDWVKRLRGGELKNQTEAETISKSLWKEIESARSATAVKPDFTLYKGTYTDTWFGEIVISEQNGKLRFDSKKSPRLSGEMFFLKGTTFFVKWDDRSMDADEYAMFSLDNTGKPVELKMKPVSPLTDFSYDFQDLEFHH